MALTGTIGTSDSLYGSVVVGFGAVTLTSVSLDVENTFAFSEVATSPIYRLAADRLFFFGLYSPEGQLAEHNYFFENVANSFGWLGVSGYDYEDDIVQYLGFSGPRVDAGFFGNYFGWSDRINRAYVNNATNAFSFISHEAPSDALLQAHNLSNIFVLTQDVDGIRLEYIYDVFGWDDSVSSSGTEYDRDFTDTFIKQHVSFKIAGAACPEKEYTPFIGSSGDTSYPAMSSTPPTLGTGTFTLTYPRVSPTTTLVLKNPEMGNSDILRFTKIDRRTRGGDRKIFSDLEWGSTQSFDLTISDICQLNVTIDEMVDFLNDSLGKEIGLLDWENRQWKGVIITPETEITPQVGGFKIQIVFEGSLV